MKHILYLIFISSFLVACGNSDNKLPQECKDIFDIADQLYSKMETNPYVSAAIATKYKQQNTEFLGNYKKSLLKSNDRDKQIQGCTPIRALLKSKFERLDNAKSETDVKQIFHGL